jgi:hypothetical protein
MVKISDMYGSPYLTAAELMPLGQRRLAIVNQLGEEFIGSNRDKKYVLTLTSPGGKEWKGLVLNKTNATILQAAFGDDGDNWPGRQVEIWAENVSYQGKTVAGIRVAPAEPTDPALDDEIPFR